MTTRNVIPLDLPQNFAFALDAFDDKTRNTIENYITERHAEGRWRSCEDILFDPTNLEFVSYYFQKASDPVTEPMKDSGLKEILKPYRKTQFDLTHPKGSMRKVSTA